MPVKYLLIAVVVLFTVGMSGGSSYAEINPESIVGLWFFDEGQGDVAKDSSGNGNDGTLKGGPEWVNGKFGKALSFDGGDDIVEVQNPSKMDLTDAVTATMLLKSPADSIRSLALSKNDNLNGFRFEVKPSLYWCIEKGDALKCIKSDLPREEWVYLVGTFDGKETKLYIDGEQAGASLPAADGLGNAAKSLIIGAHRFAGDLPFNGLIDEVAVFNVALEEEDIQDIVGQGLKAALGLAAVYPAGKLTTTWAGIKAWD